MTFQELVALVQTEAPLPNVFSDFRGIAYRQLKLIREISTRISAELAVDMLTAEEYRRFRKELDENFRWLREWFAREEQREQIRCKERKKLLALGQLYKQALKEENELAICMADLWSGIRDNIEEYEEEEHE